MSAAQQLYGVFQEVSSHQNVSCLIHIFQAFDLDDRCPSSHAQEYNECIAILPYRLVTGTKVPTLAGFQLGGRPAVLFTATFGKSDFWTANFRMNGLSKIFSLNNNLQVSLFLMFLHFCQLLRLPSRPFSLKARNTLCSRRGRATTATSRVRSGSATSGDTLQRRLRRPDSTA